MRELGLTYTPAERRAMRARAQANSPQQAHPFRITTLATAIVQCTGEGWTVEPVIDAGRPARLYPDVTTALLAASAYDAELRRILPELHAELHARARAAQAARLVERRHAHAFPARGRDGDGRPFPQRLADYAKPPYRRASGRAGDAPSAA